MLNYEKMKSDCVYTCTDWHVSEGEDPTIYMNEWNLNETTLIP